MNEIIKITLNRGTLHVFYIKSVSQVSDELSSFWMNHVLNFKISYSSDFYQHGQDLASISSVNVQ